jgi:hypothetical protein
MMNNIYTIHLGLGRKLETRHITYTLLVPEILHVYVAILESRHITYTLLVPEILHVNVAKLETRHITFTLISA